MRRAPTWPVRSYPRFQSTHSLRSATPDDGALRQANKFQSTHSLRSATIINGDNPRTTKVSIHALLAECDPDNKRNTKLNDSFNPRTPCGVRLTVTDRVCKGIEFQSTHSLRSATLSATATATTILCFNPRTPCGVRLLLYIQKTKVYEVSIHALLAECDRQTGLYTLPKLVSIHALLAECDRHFRGGVFCPAVSIHALLAECDCAQPYTLLLNKANHTLRQPP